MAETPKPRPEFVRERVAEADFGIVQRPLPLAERLANIGALRKTLILLVLAVLWEAYARYLNNALLVPTFTATLRAFVERSVTGELPLKAWVSVKVLMQGYAIGLALGLVLTVLAMLSRWGNDLLEALTAMFKIGRAHV